MRCIEGIQGPRMRVDGKDALMFAGANYLDLAGDPRVIRASIEAAERAGCAAGGARLISGNLALHEELEAELAAFLGMEAALIFSTGYMANVGVLTSLAGSEDVIVSDSLNHASIIDACRMSHATSRVFRHNDIEDFERVAKGLDGFRRRVLIIDGVYSMDGDIAALRELIPIARKYGLWVVLDDVHGMGVLGENGRGTAELEDVEVDAVIGNLGKALGSFGAFVACSDRMREFLVNTSRSFIFTCGLAPSPVGAAAEGLRILRAEPERRKAVLERAEQLRRGLQKLGYGTGESTTHIVPAIIGKNSVTMKLCEAALAAGVHAQGIRYPSVPEGTARIRFTPMSSHSVQDVDDVLDLFGRLSKALTV